MVALAAPNGSGEARAESTNRQRDKGPEQGVCDRLASSFRCRLSGCEGVGHPLIRICDDEPVIASSLAAILRMNGFSAKFFIEVDRVLSATILRSTRSQTQKSHLPCHRS
jgi:hypothetical protein